MPRFTHRAPMLRILPHLEFLEDRSVPSVSPLNGLVDSTSDRPNRAEVEQTIDRLENAAKDWPALHDALDNLTTKQTINIASQLTNADTDTVAKVVKNIAENRPTTPTPDVVSDDPILERPIRETKSPVVAPGRLYSNLDTLRAASLNMDTAQEVSSTVSRQSSLGGSASPIAALLNGETSQEASTTPLEAKARDEANPVNPPKGTAVGKFEVGALALPLGLSNEVDAALSAAITAEAVKALASADMMEAALPADSSALADFITHLNRVGESLGLPEGSGATAWVVAAALAMAACEIARRQIRASRHSVSLAPDDVSDTLSWSLSLR